MNAFDELDLSIPLLSRLIRQREAVIRHVQSLRETYTNDTTDEEMRRNRSIIGKMEEEIHFLKILVETDFS